MANEITLPVGATAEPDTCGSCKFFRRQLDNGDWYAMNGWCGFKLPPQYALKTPTRSEEESWQSPDRVVDTDRCDLYRYSGKVYIVQRRIPPERAG